MLYEIMSCSVAAEDITRDDILEIYQNSKKYNAEHDITGCLLYYNHNFLQVLEGPRENLEILQNTIWNDPRHHDLEILEKGEIERRMYPTWTMAFNDSELCPKKSENGIIGLEEFIDLANFTRKCSTAKNLFWTLGQEMLAVD